MKKNLLLCLIILSSIFRLQADSWTYHRYVGLEGVNVIIPSDSDHFWTRIDNFTFWKFDGKSKEPELLTLNSLCKNFKADKFNNLWTVQDSTGFFVYKENQIQYIPIPDSFLFPQYFEITNFFIDNKANKSFSRIKPYLDIAKCRRYVTISESSDALSNVATIVNHLFFVSVIFSADR